eukprot:1540054-Rhodomonas_salina.1
MSFRNQEIFQCGAFLELEMPTLVRPRPRTASRPRTRDSIRNPEDPTGTLGAQRTLRWPSPLPCRSSPRPPPSASLDPSLPRAATH